MREIRPLPEQTCREPLACARYSSSETAHPFGIWQFIIHPMISFTARFRRRRPRLSSAFNPAGAMSNLEWMSATLENAKQQATHAAWQ